MLAHPAVCHGTGTESVRSEEMKSACQFSVTGPSGLDPFFFFFPFIIARCFSGMYVTYLTEDRHMVRGAVA